ncbi:EF-hand [Zopfochytrium polystomum]|nr:EF-hand [Zopfochytrium polystomum]
MGTGGSKLQPELLEDLQARTSFDKKELQQWYKGFMQDCPSGSLDKVEFLKIYRQFFPFGDPTAFVEFAFAAIDENKNGKIDFPEFVRALSVSSRGSIEDRLTWAFQFYDTNHDGMISRDEMLSVVSAIFKMVGGSIRLPPDEDSPEKRVAKIFDQMDRNNDGKLDFEEFRDGSKLDPTILNALSLYNGLV